MKTHEFILILSGISELEPAVANVLFEATGGDIEFNMRNQIPFLEFSRQAPSIEEAVQTAIRQVEQAGVGIRVVRVESDVANFRT